MLIIHWEKIVTWRVRDMDEHFLEYVEKLRYILGNNNRSDVTVNISYLDERVYYKIDGRYTLVYSFTEVLDKAGGR